MDKSENSKEVERLYLQVCNLLKQYRSGGDLIPSRDNFLRTLKTFNRLIEGHKSLLTAIGKL